jgi:hypothetical protein
MPLSSAVAIENVAPSPNLSLVSAPGNKIPWNSGRFFPDGAYLIAEACGID